MNPYMLVAMKWICSNLQVIGYVSWGIGALGVLGILKYLDSVIDKGLNIIQSRFNRTFANATRKLGSIAQATLLVVIGSFIIPSGLVSLVITINTYWHPSSLVNHPEFGLCALAVPLLVWLANLLFPRVKEVLIPFFSQIDKDYRRVLLWCYISIILMLLAPSIVFHLFDYVLPLDFFFVLLMQLIVSFYAYAFGTLWIALFYALLGALWLVIMSVYLIVHNLNRHPNKAIGIFGFLIGTVAITVEGSNLCQEFFEMK